MPSTTNFSWTTPADTDLVKDGALAIRTLGNGIDTSLVDLKGGTTGQALTKATNTDLDYSWTDIIPANQSFFAAKNRVLNSDYSIWQRGTSFTLSGTAYTYTADRWECLNISGATTTVSRQSFTAGTAPVAGYEGEFFLRYVTTDTTTGHIARQKIENVRTFAGESVTISFWAKVGSGTRTVSMNLIQNFGSGGSADVATAVTFTDSTLTTSWKRIIGTATLPSISGKTIGSNNCLIVPITVAAGNATLDLWGVQIEAGNVASAFQTATGNRQAELAACQRYYIRFTANQIYSFLQNPGYGRSTTQVSIPLVLPTTMRVYPTAIETTANLAVSDGTNRYKGGTWSIDVAGSPSAPTVTYVHTAATLTQYRSYGLQADNDATVYVGLSAEL